MIDPKLKPLKPQSINDLPEHGKIALRSHQRAARKLRKEHRMLGLPLIVWENGRVVRKPA